MAVSFLRVDASTETARQFRVLVDEAGGAAQLNRPEVAGALLGQLARMRQPGPEGAAMLVRSARARARAALRMADERRIGCLHAGQPDYPDRLWQIPDPPAALWFLGRPGILSLPSVAVVGARRATPSGLSVAVRLSRELSEAGLVVVSGLARGVDGAAHEGALNAEGATVAVLGCGADLVYPPEHRDLARRICQTGALVTEFPPGSQPLPWRFPLRNRIISGLSRAVVVVEASERSGSLITARAALEQGRDVLAVPGSVASGRYRGGHALIKDGARLVETVDDVLEEIGWRRPPGPALTESDKDITVSSLEMSMARGETYSLDELARVTGLGAPELLSELARLELAGRVVRVGGGNFAKT